MPSTTFSDYTTVVSATWLNEVNGVVWTLFGATTTASGGRTALGLGTISTQASSNVSITGGSITGTSITLPSSGITFNDGTIQTTAAIGFGFKNRFINGNMQIAQRGTSASVTAGTAVPTVSTGYPSVDRWFVYCTGANVTAAQVAGTGATKNRLTVTSNGSVTAVGIGQRIEQNNSYDLAGGSVTVSLDIATSLSQDVTWTLNYANTADTFGTIGTPTKTQVPSGTGTLTTTSTITRKTFTVALPAAATTGLELVLTTGAMSNTNTITVGNIQLEAGTINSSFDVRPYSVEWDLCQRYYQKPSGILGGALSTTIVADFVVPFPVAMRIGPTLTQLSGSIDIRVNGTTTSGVSGTWTSSNVDKLGGLILFTRASGTWTAGTPAFVNQNSSNIDFRAEL